jgi:hypothetical protein
MALGAQAAAAQQQQQPLPSSGGAGGGGLRLHTGGRLQQLRDPRAVVEQVRKNSMYQPLQGAVSSPSASSAGVPPLPRPITTIQPPTPHTSGYQQQPQRRQSGGAGPGRRPHSASPAGGFSTNAPNSSRPYSTYGTNVSSPRVESPHHSMYGGSPHPQSAGVSGGFGGGYGGGQQAGVGGGRAPSPGRKPSPGPGRMGKLSVGVDGNEIPPVPALPAGTGECFFLSLSLFRFHFANDPSNNFVRQALRTSTSSTPVIHLNLRASTLLRLLRWVFRVQRRRIRIVL